MRLTPRYSRIVAFIGLLGAVSAFAQGSSEAGTSGGLDAMALMRRSQMGMTAAFPQEKVSVVASERDGLFEAVDESTYTVGPGDYFQVEYGGKGRMAVVNSEGYLVVDGTSPVQVSGKTLLRAKADIRRAVGAQVRNEAVNVTLAQAKVFQVSLVGEVGNPGFYTVSSGMRLSSLIDRAGGFSFLATRRLQLTNSFGKAREVDLGAYYRDGDLEQNPYLGQGDRIFAPRMDLSGGDVAYVRGEKGLRAVQLAPGDNLEEVLRRLDNFRGGWEWLSVRVYRDDRHVETVARKDAQAYKPEPGTVLEPQAVKNVVFVGGMVLQPGYFGYNPSFTVQDYIALAGVTVGTAKAARGAEVLDAQGKTRKVGAEGGPLHPGDHILVSRSGEAATRDYVNLFSSISGVAVALATLYVLVGTQ